MLHGGMGREAQTPAPVPGAEPYPPAVMSLVFVRIKGKLKLILRVQGDLWGLAFFSLIIHYF